MYTTVYTVSANKRESSGHKFGSEDDSLSTVSFASTTALEPFTLRSLAALALFEHAADGLTGHKTLHGSMRANPTRAEQLADPLVHGADKDSAPNDALLLGELTLGVT